MKDTAKHILYEAVLKTRPALIESFRQAVACGIPASRLKQIVKKMPEYQQSTLVMPGAILAAIEVVYEREKQLPAAPRGGQSLT